MLASYAAPTGWWLTAIVVGAVAGWILVVLSGLAVWLCVPVLSTALAVLADAYWRHTRPPSVDGPWSLLARRMYRRRPPAD